MLCILQQYCCGIYINFTSIVYVCVADVKWLGAVCSWVLYLQLKMSRKVLGKSVCSIFIFWCGKRLFFTLWRKVHMKSFIPCLALMELAWNKLNFLVVDFLVVFFTSLHMYRSWPWPHLCQSFYCTHNNQGWCDLNQVI